MFSALLVISIIFNVILIYTSILSLRKIEQYEDMTLEYESRILWFYDESNKILAAARNLDRREMFEKDDDVGQLFQQLIDTIGDLRKLIYDTEKTEEQGE